MRNTDHNGNYGSGQHGTPGDSAAHRAKAWMHARLMRGSKDRYVEIVRVTPAMAEELLTINTHNRNPIRAAVQEYATAMTRGEWQLTAEAISVSRDGVLLNGQNRLMAVVESGATLQVTIWWGCERDEFRVADGGRRRKAAQQMAILGVPNATIAAALAKSLWIMHTRTTADHLHMLRE
jgi:hypothetical protein